MKTIKLLSLVLILFIFTFQSYSQTKQDSSSNSLKKGSWAIQFGIGNNFTLGSFNNYTFSIKYHVSKRSAIRLGIGGYYSDQSGNGTNQSVTGSMIQKNYSFQSELLYIYYVSSKSNLNFYLGGGAVYNYTYTHQRLPNAYEANDNLQQMPGGGIKAVAGCEWFFMNRVSLFAEYQAQFTFNKSTVTTDDVSYTDGTEYKNSYDLSGFQFANIARFGLSVYF